MTVAGILKQKGREVVSVPPTLRVDELARVLHARRIGAALVLDVTGALMGIVSERDVVGALATSGSEALSMTAAQLMTAGVTTATAVMTVQEAMAVMTAGRFRHLPVLEGGRVVGLVSIGDVVKALIDEQSYVVDSLKAYVAGAA